MKKLLCALIVLLLAFPPVVWAEASSAPAAGDILLFGRFEQDNDLENGPEPIEWLVLEVREGEALLLSLRGLECLPLVTESFRNFWQDCSLRAWLNGDFMASAFTTEEQAAVRLAAVANGADQSPPQISMTGGADTEDHVFLLSYAELMRYFPAREARACRPTPYAAARGVVSHVRTGNCDWWLRSPGQSGSGRAAVVTLDVADFDVMYVDFTSKQRAVRPAMWVELSAAEGLLTPVGEAAVQ